MSCAAHTDESSVDPTDAQMSALYESGVVGPTVVTIDDRSHRSPPLYANSRSLVSNAIDANSSPLEVLSSAAELIEKSDLSGNYPYISSHAYFASNVSSCYFIMMLSPRNFPT